MVEVGYTKGIEKETFIAIFKVDKIVVVGAVVS
jgi:hypothetical protein